MIDFLRNLFTVNHELIYFIYGLMFFVLGLAIALQSRHSSRLDLARSLNWLAAFGFLHGFHEWGDLFVPLQAQYLSAWIILYLKYLDLLLLAVSFACLYGFGLALLEPLQPRRWLHVVYATFLVVWLGLILGPFRMWFPGFSDWYNSADALARYLIGLPSGLLAAYALREHTFKRIAPLNVPRIVQALRLSGVAMGLYALAAGLVPPPVSFFPGNIINTSSWTLYLVVPPQLIRALIGLTMALTTIRSLEIFDVETSRRIEAMEVEGMLANERERIARELHDGTIQKVYTAGLLVRSAGNLAPPDTPLAGRLATAVGVLDDAITDLRQNLSQLQAPTRFPEPLEQTIRKLAADPRFSSFVTVDLALDLPQAYSLTPERTVHVLAILQEALANIVRHAYARRVLISANKNNEDRLVVVVKDDGIGLPAQLGEGYGLRNMRDRASLLHGELKVEKLEKGKRVTLVVPLEGK